MTKTPKGKTLVLSPEERYAALQALGHRRSYLQSAYTTPAGDDQLHHIKNLIHRLGYNEDEAVPDHEPIFRQ